MVDVYGLDIFALYQDYAPTGRYLDVTFKVTTKLWSDEPSFFLSVSSFGCVLHDKDFNEIATDIKDYGDGVFNFSEV